MNQKLRIATIATATSALALSAFSQGTTEPAPETNENRLGNLIQARDFIGMDVMSTDELLGVVKEVAMDTESGQIVYVIVSSGEYLDTDDAHFALPPTLLHEDDSREFIRLDASLEKLESAPRFRLSRWEQGVSPRRINDIYRYYGQPPYHPDGMESADAPQETEEPQLERRWSYPAGTGPGPQFPRETAAQQTEPDADGTSQVSSIASVEGAPEKDEPVLEERWSYPAGTGPGPQLPRKSPADQDGGLQSTAQTASADDYPHLERRWSYPAGTGPGPQLKPEDPALPPRDIQQASQFIEMHVINLQDEQLGDVDNLLIDLSAARVFAVVVTSEAFLDQGNGLSAVPPTALQFDKELEVLKLDASKEAFSQAPHFLRNEWPDFTRISTAGEVYAAYQVDPYFSPAGTDPDPITYGGADRTGTLIAATEGDSDSDADINDKIRSIIGSSERLPVDGNNVIITTTAGQVTLEGEVNTAEERQLIEEIVADIEDVTEIDNRIIVHEQ